MKDIFLENTTIIQYSDKNYEKTKFSALSEIDLPVNVNGTKWINTHGLEYPNDFKTVVLKNKLNDFLIKLLSEDEHATKVIIVDNLLFVNIKVLRTEVINLGYEQMIFIVFSHFLWSIQEKPGDYYNWIRERLTGHKGIVRKKKADYLLYLIIEAIMGNFQDTYLNHAKISDSQLNATHIKPTPELTSLVQTRKQELFNF